MQYEAIYARVSTDKQAEKGFSIEAQVDRLKAHCELDGIKPAQIKEYIDPGFTGSNMDRPELKRLIEDIELGIINSVRVYKLDRLSRKTKDTLYLVEDIFNKNGVKFISLNESIDTSTSSGKFFLSILSSVAQLERENIKERMMLGSRKKAELGIKSRRPKILIGYDWDEDKKCYVINEYEAMQIKKIFDDCEAGISLGNILKSLIEGGYKHKYGKWSCLRAIQNVLTNEGYTGKLRFQGVYLPSNNPVIISQEQFDRVQILRQKRREQYFKPITPYLLTSLLYCGICGARVRGTTARHHVKKTKYYTCYSRLQSWYNSNYMVKDKNCKLPWTHTDVIENKVVKAIMDISKSLPKFEMAKNRNNESGNQYKIATLENEIKKISNKTSKLYDLFLDDKIVKNDLNIKLEELIKNKSSLEEQLSKLKQQQIKKLTITFEELKEETKDFEKRPPEEQRPIIKKLINKIFIFPNSIEIDWAF